MAMALAAPVAAADTAAEAEIAAIEAMGEAIARLDYDSQKDAMRDGYVAMRDRARAAAELYAGDPATANRLRALQGHAIFNAAQHNDPEWADVEGQKAEIIWLAETVEVLAPVLAAGVAGDDDRPNYAFRGAAGQLYSLGVRFRDPRLPDWSATRVLANRYRSKAFPDSDFEKHLLVEALYDHAVQVKDRGLIDEADGLAATIREEDLREAVQDMRAMALASGL
ncbi:hypothetical protein ATE62_15035 [Sphingopyxis sp. HIX]|nr:hypothetical protein ATE62_15035 [Sphingopyxis sp. HIX]KTE83547.1 hypothetical protein ATE72_13300 [Sphingopyxis sp. HXXIV]